jgi:hypothetical protein
MSAPSLPRPLHSRSTTQRHFDSGTNGGRPDEVDKLNRACEDDDDVWSDPASMETFRYTTDILARHQIWLISGAVRPRTLLRTLVHTRRERRIQRCRGAQECDDTRGHQIEDGLLHIQHSMYRLRQIRGPEHHHANLRYLKHFFSFKLFYALPRMINLYSFQP